MKRIFLFVCNISGDVTKSMPTIIAALQYNRLTLTKIQQGCVEIGDNIFSKHLITEGLN